MAFHSYFVDVFLFSGFGYSNLLVNNLPCFIGTFRCWAQINKDNLGFLRYLLKLVCRLFLLVIARREVSIERREKK